MKTTFQNEEHDCTLVAPAEDGLIDIDLWLFEKTDLNKDVKNLYRVKVKWQGTIRQNKKDLLIIWSEEKWIVVFENLQDEKETLARIFNKAFDRFQEVFTEYAENFGYGKLTLSRPVENIDERVNGLLEQMTGFFVG